MEETQDQKPAPRLLKARKVVGVATETAQTLVTAAIMALATSQVEALSTAQLPALEVIDTSVLTPEQVAVAVFSFPEPVVDDVPQTGEPPLPDEPTKLNGEPLPDYVVTKVVLDSPYGFYDNDGVTYRSWHAGQEVTDPRDIELLVLRDAPATLFGDLEAQ